MVEIEADDAGWKMENMIACGPSKDDIKKHFYLVTQEGFTQEENTWETCENVMEHVEELLEEYYEKNETMERDKRFVQRKSAGNREAVAQRKIRKTQKRKTHQDVSSANFVFIIIEIILFRYLGGIFCFVHFFGQSYHWVTGP